MSKLYHYMAYECSLNGFNLSFAIGIKQSWLMATVRIQLLLTRGCLMDQYWVQYCSSVFINELPDLDKSQCRLSADDWLVYNEIKTVDDSLQLPKDLKLLESCAEKKGIQFSAKKWHLISTEKGVIPFFYTIHDHILKYVSTNPCRLYLSVAPSEDLTFDAHVDNITKKGSRRLGFIQRNVKCLKEMAHLTLVRSILSTLPLSDTHSCRGKCITSKRSSAGGKLGWDILQERLKQLGFACSTKQLT